jgi:hypothetical protein
MVMVGVVPTRRTLIVGAHSSTTSLFSPATLKFPFVNLPHMIRKAQARQSAPRTPERAEMLTRVDPTLDRPVILFQDVIESLSGKWS